MSSAWPSNDSTGLKMNVTIFWCAHCSKYVTPTIHDVTEQTKSDWGDSTWEAMIERRCPSCVHLVISRNGCVECRAAEVAEGVQRCGTCSAGPATGSGQAKTPPDVTVADIFRDGLDAIHFTGTATVEQIGRACAMFSTDTHEVVGHIYSVNGKPVVSLRREPRPAGLDAMLRPGSEEPLSFLTRKQAS